MHELNREIERPETGEPVDEEPNGEQAKRLWWRPLILIIVLVGIALAVRFSGAHGWFDLQALTGWLESVGRLWWAPLVVVVLYVVFNLLGLPGSVLTLAAGVVWGWLVGGLVALVGSTAGTAVPYLLALTHARFIEEHMRKRAAWLHSRLRREGFTALLMFRLAPAVPYALINYAAGFAGIRPTPYFVATFIGTIPGVFIYTWLADSIFGGLISIQGAFARIAIAGGLLAGLVLVSRIVARRLGERR